MNIYTAESVCAVTVCARIIRGNYSTSVVTTACWYSAQKVNKTVGHVQLLNSE